LCEFIGAIQAVRVQSAVRLSVGSNDHGGNADAASSAEQEIRSQLAESVPDEQLRIADLDAQFAVRVCGGPRAVASTERTLIGPELKLRQSRLSFELELQIAAMTLAG
jgi:hypothetical protein